MTSVCSRCPLLRNLNLSDCWQLTDISGVQISSHLFHVELLNLSGCRRISDATMSGLSSARLLKDLDLSYCVSVSDHGIAMLAHGCERLERFNVSYCEDITDASLSFLFGRCRRLVDVSLDGCTAVGEAALVALAWSNPQLERLSAVSAARAVTPGSMEAIAAGCPRLKYLRAGRCSRLDDDAVAALCSRCRQLKAVDLSSCDIGDDAALSLSLLCSSLHHINLCGNPRLTNASLAILVNMCSDVEYLNLAGCAIQDSAFRDMSSIQRRLQVLVVGSCTELTSTVFSGISFAALREIKLSYCSELSDDSINDLCGGAPDLESIDIGGLKHLTNHSVLQIVSTYRSTLLELCIRGLPRVTDAAMHSLLEAHRPLPRLRTLDVSYCSGISTHTSLLLARRYETVIAEPI